MGLLRLAPSRRRAGALAAALTAGLLLAPGPAAAHQSSVAYSDVVVDGRDVDDTIQIASTDLYEALGIDKERAVSRDEVLAGQARLLAYLAAHVHVATADLDCPAEPAGLSFVDKADGFFIAAHLHFRCPRLVARATMRYDLFFDLDPRHQGIARLSFSGSDEDGGEKVFRADARTLAITRALGVWDHVRDYLILGIEHIFTGYDHIAFVFGLLIVAGAHGLRAGARRILGVVTAFTLAHSVTLIASALGLVSLSSRLVEPAIALSIAYVGVENLLRPEPRHRFALTFCFGLVHGFGFASVLKEIGLPEKGLLLSLVSFNVGVEIGQLAVVAAVLPVLALIARPSSAPPLPILASLRLGPWAERLAELGVFVLPCAGATFVLFTRFGVAAAPVAAVVFGGAPLLFLFGRRYGYDTVVRRVGSAVIASLAIFWFIERVARHELLGGWLG